MTSHQRNIELEKYLSPTIVSSHDGRALLRTGPGRDYKWFIVDQDGEIYPVRGPFAENGSQGAWIEIKGETFEAEAPANLLESIPGQIYEMEYEASKQKIVDFLYAMNNSGNAKAEINASARAISILDQGGF